MSPPVLALVGVLIGAGVAALTSVITALVTAKLTERRETRARLFDARRKVYVEALRAAGIARHAVTDSIPEDAAVGVAQASIFMSQLELLATPHVHRAYGELMVPLTEALERRMALPQDATEADLEALFSSQRMQLMALTVRDEPRSVRAARRIPARVLGLLRITLYAVADDGAVRELHGA